VKGQANLIEHVLTISFSLIILISVSTIIYNFYSTSINVDVEKGLRELSIQTVDNIIRLYKNAKGSSSQPSNSTSVLISQLDLSLPSQVSGRNYEIYLVGANNIWINIINFTVSNQNVTSVIKTPMAKVIARTTQNPIISIEYDIPNVDVGVQGRSANGINSKISYYRYNYNGTVYDKIVLGQSDVLIDITNMGW